MTQSITEDTIFADYKEMLEPRCRYIGVGAGWMELVHTALNEIRTADPDVKIVQIKEKFGGLRIYHSRSSSDGVARAIAVAEDLASTTCDVCGSMAHVDTVMSGGWMRTRCPIHVDTTRD